MLRTIQKKGLYLPKMPRRARSAGFTLLLGLAVVPVLSANTYYVATSGNDSNFGTVTSPFATVNKGVSAAGAGDTVYVRGGTYNQTITISKSGSSAGQLVVAGYPGETAIFDGKGSIPAGDGTYPMILVSGNYVTVQDLTVQNAYGIGLQLQGSYGQALRINSYRNWSTGLRVTSGSNNLVQNCNVYWNSRSNDRSAGNSAQYWGAGLSVNGGGVNHTTVSGNKVWNNWGEGLSTFGASYTTIQDNTVWDNYANNLYVSDAQYILVQRNLAYMSTNSAIGGYGGAQTNIEVGDETGTDSSNNTIINNFAMGGSRVLSCCTGAANNVIANNTFVNASPSAVATVQIWSGGNYSNAEFVDNIIEEDGSVPIANFASGTGLRISNNLWSKTPPSAGSSSSDMVTNPQLSRTGATTAGNLSPNWFKLGSGSPAIHKGISVSQVTQDFFLDPRGNTPDIGGDQFVSGSGGSATLDTTPPSVPQNLTVGSATATQVTISWTASTDNVGVTGYRVYRNGVQAATVTTTSYQDTNVSPSAGYVYAVAAYDAAGNISSQSASVSASTPAAADTTAPSRPTGLSGTAVSATTIQLSWSASTDNVGVAGYNVYRGGVAIGKTSATAYQSTGLIASTQYSYTVAAYDGAGNVSQQSSAVSVTTPAASSGSSGGSSSGTTPGTGPYAWWKLDDGTGSTPTDSSGSGLTATMANSPAWQSGSSCELSNCLAFNGANQYGTASLNLSDTNVVTLAFWMKWNAFANDDKLAFEFTSDNNSHTGGFMINPDSAWWANQFEVSMDGNAGQSAVTFARPTAGVWHHYTIVLNKGAVAGSQITPYVDGKAVAYTAQMSPDNTNNFAADTLYFMSRGGSSLFGAGSLNDVRIYKRALSAAEISALANPTPSGGSSGVSSTTNLALNKPAYSSANQASTFPASAAFDGNTATRWSSTYSDPQWIYVDLGSTYAVNKVVLNWEYAYGKAYQIQVSTDGSTWTTVYSQTAGTGSNETLTFAPVNARYVRMYGTQRGTPYGYSLWEMQVYGSAAQ